MDIVINILLVVIALALTIFLLKKEVNLGIVMLVNSVFIAVIAGMPIGNALKYAYRGAVSISTIKLVLLLFLIMMLENIMRNTGMIRSMVNSLKEVVGGNRLAAGLLPAVIGLLPSPGGARFSCPMIEEVTKANTGSSNKSFINYWFRHIWLDGFILYPGVILAAELLKISVISMFLHLVPFMVISIIVGSVFGLTQIKKEEIKRIKPVMDSLKTFFISMLPIIFVIITYISLLNVTGFSLEIASSAVVLALLIIKKYSFKKVLKTAKEAFPVKLVLIILGVMVFKEVLLDSGAVTELSILMKTFGIPVVVLYVLLPFIGGFTSGLTVSYVSLTFPILIPLGLGDNIWYAVLAFIIGYGGVMTTPLHLCAVMTADYFKTSLSKLLKRIAVAEIPLLIISLVALYILIVL